MKKRMDKNREKNENQGYAAHYHRGENNRNDARARVVLPTSPLQGVFSSLKESNGQRHLLDWTVFYTFLSFGRLKPFAVTGLIFF
jgi:hypothetical protein